jgi:predicted transposase YbfD/YdcC
MEHSTEAISWPSLAQLFAEIPDQRKAKGLRYRLPPLLILLSVAKFCQQDTPAQITDWVRHRRDFFQEKLALSWKRMPSASTWQRLLRQHIPAALLDEKVGAYFQALSPAEQRFYNLDGKVLCGTVAAESEQPLHLLALQEATTNAVVEQTELLPGENEISAARRLMERVAVKGKLISGDAIFAQQELSRRIVEGGGDYLWKLRANQGGLYRAAEAHFAASTDRYLDRAWSVEKGHGRIDERELVTSFRLAHSLEFPYLEQVFRLERKSLELKSGKLSEQTIYGLTSWSVEEAGAEALLAATRGHWGIETGLHYRRDVTFHEDASRQTTKNGGRVQAIFNNLTIGMLRKLGWENIAQARRYFEARVEEALNLILTPLPLLL